MDLTETIAPRSDQLNADDLIAGDVTVTIQEVTQGNPEQPVNVNLAEYPGRPYKPSKSMRRVLVAAWGKEASAYAGRRLTLHRNPEITFGKEKVGGIEIAAMSHLDKPLTVALTVTRGRKKTFKVQPLADAPAPAADKGTGEVIPEDVVANVARAKEDGNLPAYLDYLIEREAPQHILNYVKEQA